MAEPGTKDAFLTIEYDHAWAHYRHVETQKLQYLGFFFTALLGGAALAVPMLSSASLDTTGRLAAAALFLAVFQTVTVFVFASVRRMGSVLRHYLEAMILLRGLLAESAGVDGPAAGVLNTRGSRFLPPIPRLFSVQGLAERILIGSLALVGALSLGIAAAAVLLLAWPGFVAVAVGVLCVVGAAWCVGAAAMAVRPSRSSAVVAA